MIKRLLIVALVAVSSVASYAQGSRVVMTAPKASISLQQATPAKSISKVQGKKAETNEDRVLMGGYTSDNYGSTGLGFNQTMTYTIAQAFPQELLYAYDGGKITGMRFALVNNQCKATKAVIAVERNEVVETVLEKTIDYQQAGWCEVDFDDTYTIDAANTDYIYIGYEINEVAGAYPMAFLKEGIVCPTMAYGNLGQGIAWYSINVGDYGNLCAQAYVEGLEISPYGVNMFDFDEITVGKDDEAEATITIACTGDNAISSVEYVVSNDEQEYEPMTYTLTTPLKFSEVGTFVAKIPAQGVEGTKNIHVTITKINGVELETPVSCSGKLNVVSRFIKRNVVVEEFTGTGCGWCPRGWVGMELLREEFGDNFIGAAIHRYNSSDPMYPASYANVSFAGAPSARINRGAEMDPYYGPGNNPGGIVDEFNAELAKPAVVDVKITGEYNEDCTEVTATATVESITDGGPYTIEFVLIADGLSGTTSAWRQSNYYANYTPSQAGAAGTPVADFCSGGSMGQSSVFLTFNDVAVASSYTGTVNQAAALGTMTKDEVKESTFTLKMPTKAILRNAMQLDKVFVAAYVVNPNGTIENAAKFQLQPTEEQLGIESFTSADAEAVKYYTIDGREIAQPQSGVNIVKMSNGKTAKVVVK
ncbi:MAG: hypothetical protein SPK71_04565 [Prevotella sp.]|nr:hypothetical protein [Prevotella sp.]